MAKLTVILIKLFQLRTIEQNELAIIAESNNKAILVFTVVTIVFLPLSFFTSYFGMNVHGLNPERVSQGQFWAVCAPITLSLLVFVLVYGFRQRLSTLLLSNRPGSGKENGIRMKSQSDRWDLRF